jgi:hypothetical protein
VADPGRRCNRDATQSSRSRDSDELWVSAGIPSARREPRPAVTVAVMDDCPGRLIRDTGRQAMPHIEDADALRCQCRCDSAGWCRRVSGIGCVVHGVSPCVGDERGHAGMETRSAVNVTRDNCPRRGARFQDFTNGGKRPARLQTVSWRRRIDIVMRCPYLLTVQPAGSKRSGSNVVAVDQWTP